VKKQLINCPVCGKTQAVTTAEGYICSCGNAWTVTQEKERLSSLTAGFKGFNCEISRMEN